MSDNVDLVRRAWTAALGGDVDTVAGLLAEDVRWHAAGDDAGGCRNRAQALEWMRAAIERGAAVQVLELRELDDTRVLVMLKPAGADEPHAQVVTVLKGKIAEMVVYPPASVAEA